MKLIIERVGNKTGTQFKLMSGENEFCRTDSRRNAVLIKAFFENKKAESFQQTKTTYSILSDIRARTGIDLTTNFSRKAEIVNLRVIYCRIATDAGFSQAEIGDAINRDRSTIVHSLVKFNDFYETDRKFRELYHRLNQ